MSFYNTTQEVSTNLKQYSQKAEAQENVVLNIYRKSKKGLTAWEVFQIYPDKNTPITSIRRAISNLKRERYLIRTLYKRPGLHGKNNFIYNIYTGQLNLFK